MPSFQSTNMRMALVGKYIRGDPFSLSVSGFFKVDIIIISVSYNHKVRDEDICFCSFPQMKN